MREIELMKDKNIKFEKICEYKARIYLKNNTSYYKLISFANNFERYVKNGKFIDKYIDLDFAYLKDLSIIDYLFREIIFKMVSSIEHSLGLLIIELVKNYNLNEIDIIKNYIIFDFNTDKRLLVSIKRKLGEQIYEYLFLNNTFFKNVSLDQFLSIVTFGELVDFYDYFTKEYNLKEYHRLVYVLRDVVRLRNCVCHGQSILDNLRIKDNKFQPSFLITNFLKECKIGKYTRNNKLSNSRIRQITSAFYIFDLIVKSEGIRDNVKEKLNYLLKVRIKFHSMYYTNNELLLSVYEYFLNIIDKKFCIDEKIV